MLDVRRRSSGPTMRRQPWWPTLDPASIPTGTVVLDSCTDFPELFTPLYPLLADLFWLLDSVMFTAPEHSADSDELQSYVLAEATDQPPRALYAPGFIQRFAGLISDDWCHVVAVPPPVPDPAALLLASRDLSWRCPTAVPGCDVAFANVDAAFWRISSTRDDVLSVLRSHVASLPDWRLDDTEEPAQ